ncbi:hypothetical protein TNCV_4342951 [Trichonephila clavipes]|nr:hypothetical protein TNCV_4342951 [Trichonephila clavipes]
MGSASSMETVGAYRIFERSENHRKLQYTDYYGDGDSKAYESEKTSTRELLASDLVILSHGQESRKTPDLISPFPTSTPTEGRLNPDRFNAYRSPYMVRPSAVLISNS